MTRQTIKPSLFPFVFVAAQVDKYEKLVKEARDHKEREFRLEQWFMWKKKLIELQN